MKRSIGQKVHAWRTAGLMAAVLATTAAVAAEHANHLVNVLFYGIETKSVRR